MKGNLYQHIKIRHAYDFSLCFPHELLMIFEGYRPASKATLLLYTGSRFYKIFSNACPQELLLRTTC
jgi:hypothetical protein